MSNNDKYSLNPSVVWNEYRELETEFLNYLKYVPLTPEHYNVWSLHLGDILLKTGSILDSFFRRMIFSPIYDNVEDVKRERDKIESTDKKLSNISNYRNAFNKYYKLYDREIYVLQSPRMEYPTPKVAPFSKWLPENKTSIKKQEWWEAYNEIKHDRFINKEKATLKTTLEAISALFILIILYPDTMNLLVDQKIIKCAYTKDSTKELIIDSVKYDCILQGNETALVKTLLFEYIFTDRLNQDQDDLYSFTHSFYRDYF